MSLNNNDATLLLGLLRDAMAAQRTRLDELPPHTSVIANIYLDKLRQEHINPTLAALAELKADQDGLTRAVNLVSEYLAATESVSTLLWTLAPTGAPDMAPTSAYHDLAESRLALSTMIDDLRTLGFGVPVPAVTVSAGAVGAMAAPPVAAPPVPRDQLTPPSADVKNLRDLHLYLQSQERVLERIEKNDAPLPSEALLRSIVQACITLVDRQSPPPTAGSDAQVRIKAVADVLPLDRAIERFFSRLNSLIGDRNLLDPTIL